MLDRLEQRKDDRLFLWARSLFAIYDIEDMIRLDLPWWVLEAVDEVETFLSSRPQARVFEYGSGASTVWLARRSGSVISVEHDSHWHPVVAAKTGDRANVQLRLVPPDPAGEEDARAWGSTKPAWRDRTFRRYVEAIDDAPGTFDLIVIDGRARGACLRKAVERLAPGGLIVFDNSNRGPYRQAIRASGLSVDVARGLTACLPYPDETSLLRRAG